MILFDLTCAVSAGGLGISLAPYRFLGLVSGFVLVPLTSLRTRPNKVCFYWVHFLSYAELPLMHKTNKRFVAKGYFSNITRHNLHCCKMPACVFPILRPATDERYTGPRRTVPSDPGKINSWSTRCHTQAPQTTRCNRPCSPLEFFQDLFAHVFFMRANSLCPKTVFQNCPTLDDDIENSSVSSGLRCISLV